MNQAYLEGYYQALDDLDLYVTESIKRNGGATTAMQVLNVFNDFIAKLHTSKSYTKLSISELEQLNKEEEFKQEVEYEINEILQAMFPGANFTVIKGGQTL